MDTNFYFINQKGKWGGIVHAASEFVSLADQRTVSKAGD